MWVEDLVSWTLEAIKNLGGFGVFIGVLLESIIAPIPSPLVIMAAGFILIPAGIPVPEALILIFLHITIPGALGETLGSFIGFFVGYFGGKPIIDRWGWFLGVSWDDIKEFEKKFEKKHRDALTIFTLRSIPIVPLVVVSTVSGVLRIKLRTFTVFTLAGSIVRCTILGFAGWMVGTTYASLAGGMDFLENLVTIILLALIVFVLVTAHRRRKRRISN